MTVNLVIQYTNHETFTAVFIVIKNILMAFINLTCRVQFLINPLSQNTSMCILLIFSYGTCEESLFKNQRILSLVNISCILMGCMFDELLMM